MIRFLMIRFLLALSTAALAQSPMTEEEDWASFTKQEAALKADWIEGCHATSVMNTWASYHGGGGVYDGRGYSIVVGRRPEQALTYVTDYIGHWFYNRAARDTAAIHATTKFLGPDVSPTHGFRSLGPTFTRKAETLVDPEVKKVHALGTLARGVMTVYPKLKVLGAKDAVTGEVENPWSGLFSAKNTKGTPLFIRFSIANPVAHTLKVHGKSLSLEFIPGIGLKFLIDGRRSVDLVAMDSLAGQGADQNFFKYEFSPDFSANAPAPFNTAEGAQQEKILARYDRNPVNHHVMSLVGQRFAEIIPYIAKESVVKPHSNRGPHPFIMSIAGLAAVEPNGTEVPVSEQRRPWRLVFKPALRTYSPETVDKVKDSTPYKPGKLETDFRYKLAYLGPDNRIYEVIGETETGRRYAMGEISLSSGVVPSEFSDKLYFAQHSLEMARIDGVTIVDP